MTLPEHQLQILTTTIEQILPSAHYPGLLESLVLPHFLRHLAALPPHDAERFSCSLAMLDSESFAVFGSSYLDLHRSTRDELLDRLEADNVRLPWPAPPPRFIQQIVDLIAEVVQPAPRNQAGADVG